MPAVTEAPKSENPTTLAEFDKLRVDVDCFTPPGAYCEHRRDNSATSDDCLQGGGSHTAFTAGVLDRLLAEYDFEFDIVGLSGTSRGAICAFAT